MFLLSMLPRSWKVWLRAQYAEAELRFVRAFRSYGPAELAGALRALGVNSGDTVMLHSASGARYGFRGTIDDLIGTFLDVLGPTGNLLMVSLSYHSSSLEYLTNLKSFDVRKTPSMMGLISEYFRRRDGVMRSLHPTHPVLAYGPSAEAIITGHEDCLYPCGPGTPFGKLADLDGKVIFFNVPFACFTFFHYLEHLVSPEMPFPLYTEQPFTVPVIDQRGERRTVTTYAFSPGAIRRRRIKILEREMRRRGWIGDGRVGNTRFEVVRVRDAIECTREMLARRQYFYEIEEVQR